MDIVFIEGNYEVTFRSSFLLPFRAFPSFVVPNGEFVDGDIQRRWRLSRALQNLVSTVTQPGCAIRPFYVAGI
jgi:hypothetical protein